VAISPFRGRGRVGVGFAEMTNPQNSLFRLFFQRAKLIPNFEFAVLNEGWSMIFPKGKPRHENLMTAYADLSALLSTLKTERFSGTIELEFPEKKGILFVDSGEVVNGEAKMDGGAKRIVGQEAIRYLLSVSNQKDGLLTIYQLSPEQVAILANNLQHEILFKGLSTDFTRLDRLLLKLKEEKHTGFIEVFTKNQKPMGVLFLQEGDPVEMFTLSDSGPSVFGRKSMPALVENAIREGALLDVYRSQGKKAPAEPVPIEKGESLKEMIQIFEGVLSKAEKLVDGASQKGNFRRIFKKSLVDKSEQYPFLGPFGGEFDYRDGMVQFEGETTGKDFTQGLGACLEATLSYVEEELPKNKMLPLKLRAEIESSLEPHRETIKRLGLDPFIPSFL
jgi:hypothetical protein